MSVAKRPFQFVAWRAVLGPEGLGEKDTGKQMAP